MSRSVAAARRSPLRKLYVQVLIAIGLGILLGHFYPSLGVDLKPLSDGFIMLIRAVVPLIILRQSRPASPRWATCAGSG